MSVALVPLLFLAPLAGEVPLASAPAPDALVAPSAPSDASRPRRPAADLFDNVAIPALQLAAAEAVMALSWRIVDETQSHSLATTILLSTAPAVTLSTCAVGAASRHHRGHCWHAVLGGALGVASGVLVWGVLDAVPALNPLKKGPDDTQSFVNAVAAAIYVAAIGLPLGTVVGWNLGKDVLADDGTAVGPPAQPAPVRDDAAPTPAFAPKERSEFAVIPAPPISRSATVAGPLTFVFPLFAGTF